MKNNKTLLGTLAIMLGLLLSAQAQNQFSNGLVVYYPFDGNANDASGNTNDGIVFGAAPTTDRFANSNAAFSFNGGSGSYIEAPGSPLLNTLVDSISISSWVYLTTATSDDGAIVARRDFVGNPTGERTHFEFTVTRDLGIAFLSQNNQNDSLYFSYFESPTNVVPLSQWCSVSVTFTNGLIGLYLNGNRIASTNLGYKQLYPYNQWLDIGIVHRSGGTPYFSAFNGKIDDVRIYDRALSAGEVQQLYQYESGLRLSLIKAVKPSFYNLSIGASYQLQVSTDLTNWMNQGSPFTATNLNFIYPQYFDVDNWAQLFFRLQVVP